MTEEVGLLWWLGREPEATWEETGLFWRHGQRLPLSGDKGGGEVAWMESGIQVHARLICPGDWTGQQPQ